MKRRKHKPWDQTRVDWWMGVVSLLGSVVAVLWAFHVAGRWVIL